MLETQVKQMLEQTSEVKIIATQGPSIYIGKTSYDIGGAIFSSVQLHIDKERELWKLVKSEVHNYVVAFDLKESIATINDLQRLQPVMEHIIGNFAEEYKPLDVEPLNMITYGGKGDYALNCGRVIFMEKIGEEKTIVRTTLNEGEESAIFRPLTEINTRELHRVVKVTFCPTVSIAEYTAKEYPPQNTNGIFVNLKALKELGFYEDRNNQKRSLLDKVFGR